MSFWQEHKGTFKAAGVSTIKGVGSGTKALSKAGYSAYKNNSNKKNDGTSEVSDSPPLETRPRMNKDQLSALPPPPKRNVPTYEAPGRGEVSQYSTMVQQTQSQVPESPTQAHPDSATPQSVQVPQILQAPQTAQAQLPGYQETTALPTQAVSPEAQQTQTAVTTPQPSLSAPVVPVRRIPAVPARASVPNNASVAPSPPIALQVSGAHSSHQIGAEPELEEKRIPKPAPDASMFAPPPIHKDRGVSDVSANPQISSHVAVPAPPPSLPARRSASSSVTSLPQSSNIPKDAPPVYSETEHNIVKSSPAASTHGLNTDLSPHPIRYQELDPSQIPLPPPRRVDPSHRGRDDGPGGSLTEELPPRPPRPVATGSSSSLAPKPTETKQKKAPPPKPAKLQQQKSSQDSPSLTTNPVPSVVDTKTNIDSVSVAGPPNFAAEIAKLRLQKGSTSSLEEPEPPQMPVRPQNPQKSQNPQNSPSPSPNAPQEPLTGRRTSHQNDTIIRPADVDSGYAAEPEVKKASRPPKPAKPPKPSKPSFAQTNIKHSLENSNTSPTLSPSNSLGLHEAKNSSPSPMKVPLKQSHIPMRIPVPVNVLQKDSNKSSPPPAPPSRNSNKSTTSSTTSTPPPPPPPTRNYSRAAAPPPINDDRPPDLDLELQSGWFANTSSPLQLPRAFNGLNYSTGYSNSTQTSISGTSTNHTRAIDVRLKDLAKICYEIKWRNHDVANATAKVVKFTPSPITHKKLTRQQLIEHNSQFGEHIASWCYHKEGKMVGSGECWDLARDALLKGCGKHAFVSQYYHHGYPILEVTGSETGMSIVKGPEDEIRSGDILQFKSAKLVDKATGITQTVGDPDHTSVVTGKEGDMIHVLEQNVQGKKIVMKGQYKLANMVSGSVTVYRAVPAEWAE